MRTSESAFNELHVMITMELMDKIKMGEATTADLRAAIEWLKANNITGVAVADSPLAGSLVSSLNSISPTFKTSKWLQRN